MKFSCRWMVALLKYVLNDNWMSVCVISVTDFRAHLLLQNTNCHVQPADPTGQFITDSFGGISGLIASFWDISKQDRNFRNFRTSGYIWLYVQVFIGLNNGSNSNVIIKIQDFSGPLNSKKSWPIPFVNYDHVHNFNRKTWYIKCYLKIYDSDFLYIYH